MSCAWLKTNVSDRPGGFRPRLDRRGNVRAWLIRKFSDPKAAFQIAAEKPRRSTEVTFDMLEADFTHQGDASTFETLRLRFAINDPIISQIAEMVHDADLEDEKVRSQRGRWY